MEFNAVVLGILELYVEVGEMSKRLHFPTFEAFCFDIYSAKVLVFLTKKNKTLNI